ncbi:MAG: ATP-binding protein [Halolamina sp.]
MTGHTRILWVGESGVGERIATALDAGQSAFDLEAVDDADAALSRLAEASFDCVVSGYDLPGRDGVELLEAVREEAPDLPFVLFAAAGSEAVASDAISAGVTDYLRRGSTDDPYETLAGRIERAAEQRRAGGASSVDHRLRDAEARLNALYEESPDMIDVHGVDGRLIDANERFRSKLGYDEEEVSELDVWDIDRTRTPAEMKAVWREMETGDRLRLEGQFETATGETFPVEVHLRRLDVDGDPLFVVISRDITERVERRERLRDRNERLEEFASVVSHDLRSPLQIATGRLSLARSERDSEHLERAEAALERMDDLIDDLLTLARHGERSRELQTVGLEAVVRRCWHTLDAEGATLSVDVDAEIRADEAQLRQLLENLVTNAVEHGGPAATVIVGRLDDEDDNGFYVADDGPGVPEDEREAVFEAGYSTGEDGTGFGLRIVGQVADAHDWTVTVTDSADGGARFEVGGVEFVN